jgi:hypothetical protein
MDLKLKFILEFRIYKPVNLVDRSAKINHATVTKNLCPENRPVYTLLRSVG